MSISSGMRRFACAALGAALLFGFGSCSMDILNDIKKEIEGSKETEKPKITSFNRTSPAVTNNTVVQFSLAGSVNIKYWLVNESSTAPDKGDSGWVTTAPSGYTLSATPQGPRNVFAWAKTSSGLVSEPFTPITVTLDTVKPIIDTFTRTSASPTIYPNVTFDLSSTSSSDIWKWMLNESATAPLPGDSGWLSTKPTSYNLSSPETSGTRMIYAWARDEAGNVSDSKSISVVYNAVAELPVIDAFTLTSADPTNLLTVTFSLSGNSYVTNWLVNESSSAPSPTGGGWTANATPPTSYILAAGEGARTIYAWAKNASNVVSTSRSITLTLDTVLPTIDSFTRTSASPTSDPNVTFTLSGSSDVWKWMLNESATAPLPGDSGWLSTKPTTYGLSGGSGTRTIYAWARDEAGNVSVSKSISVVYNAIAELPVINAFALTSADPTNSTTVTFTLSGNSYVTNWLVNESSSVPSATGGGWTANATPPTSYILAAGEGARTIYAWAKNASNVVSTSRSITLTLDTVKPTVSSFALTSAYHTDNRNITISLAGSDATSGISGWLRNESPSTPGLGDAGWSGSGTPPTTYQVSAGVGLKTVYAWARDAAGNISDSFAPIEVDLRETPVGTLSGGTTRVGHERIVITFNDDMALAKLNIGGDIGTPAIKDMPDSKTLTLDPDPVWPKGSVKTLTITGKSALDIDMTPFSASFTIDHRIYVRDDYNGSNGYVGSASAPKTKISDAITVASTSYVPTYAVDILVTEGTYSSDFKGTGSPVASLVEKASIYGGYVKTSNWSTRDPQNNPTIFQDSSTTSATSLASANRAIHCGSGITTATIIDGCKIQAAASGQYCAAVVCDGGSPLLKNCTILGGPTSTASNSFGVLSINSAAPEIANCTIDGGTGTISRGIYAYSSSSPYIHGNTISGGEGSSKNYSIGIENETSSAPRIFGNSIRAGTTAYISLGIRNKGSSAPKIYNNTISGGLGGNSFDSGTASGIYNDASSPDICNNSIDGGLTSSAYTPLPRPCGIYNANSSKPTIKNNIIFTRSGPYGWGIYEKGVNDDPASVQNNDIFACGNGLYYDEGTTAKTIDEVNALGAGYSGNQSLDAKFANQSGYDWHLTTTTPTEVHEGGLDLSGLSDFPKNAGGQCTDITGTAARTSPWSMGAYEYD